MIGDVTQKQKEGLVWQKKAFNDLTNILTKRKVNLDTRKRIFNSYVWSILSYGCETWTISKNMEMNLKSLELWIFRCILKVSWLDRQNNEIIVDRFGSHRSQINACTKRQIYFLTIDVEKKSLKKRARGRQRKDYISSMMRRMVRK